MASTLTASTLTVAITESIELNGKDQGGSNVLTIGSIATISKRIIDVPASEVTIIAISTAVANGTFIEGDVRYIRITNLDDTNHITLTFANENDDEAAIKLDAGQSFVMNGDNSGGMVDMLDAIDGTGLTYSLGDMKSVTADADTGSCDLEIYVASIA